jgi:hypothetical protein
MELICERSIQVKRRGELILMNSRNYVQESALEAGNWAALIVIAGLALTLPLPSQQSAIGGSTEPSGSVSQPASAASKQAQQVDQDPTVVKQKIEHPAEESPIEPSTIVFDDGPPARSAPFRTSTLMRAMISRIFNFAQFLHTSQAFGTAIANAESANSSHPCSLHRRA